MENLLEISDLSLDLKQDDEWKSILHHVSFNLAKGETLGIVGESGSGKSVSALSIMRLLNPKIASYPNGSITFYEEDAPNQAIDLLNCPEEQMQHIRGNKIAMIFQEPMTSLNPVIKCGQQITEQILLHTKTDKLKAREQVIELFKEVMLPRPDKIFRTNCQADKSSVS